MVDPNSNQEETKELPEPVKSARDTYYIDGILYDNLMLTTKKVRQDWDFCYVVDGIERGGKSIFTQMLAFTVYNGLSLADIVFTPRQFEDAVNNAKQYQAIIYDEAYGGLNSRASMSRVNQTLVRMMTEIGFKNLFIFIVLPNFFELQPYVAIHRSRGLFHIYTGKDMERGYFRFYNYESKKLLYLLGKKGFNYSVVNPNFYGRFTNQWFVDKEAYTEKKRKSRLEVEESNKIIKKAEDYWREVEDRIKHCVSLTNKQRAELLGISERRFYQREQEGIKDEDDC